MKKIALIFGITGQDGAYLTELLLKKGYYIHGVKRRSSLINTKRIDQYFNEIQNTNNSLTLHYGDVTDPLAVNNLINLIKPKEIYNLAAQSHVKTSFEIPLYTANVDALGTLNILESIRQSKLKDIKFYQASSSEMFGKVSKISQDENTEFYPRSPYAVSKIFSYWIVRNYREAYDIFASNGILFNHESPLRGETFVTKKIIKGIFDICHGNKKTLYLGNINSKRDWGHARDYVKAMWLMLQQKKPDDFVIATNKTYSIREFLIKSFKKIGITIRFIGSGLNEKAIILESKIYKDLKKNQIVVKIDKRYFRPTEVDYLKGNYSKAKKILKWEPSYNLDELISDMIDYEFNN